MGQLIIVLLEDCQVDELMAPKLSIMHAQITPRVVDWVYLLLFAVKSFEH